MAERGKWITDAAWVGCANCDGGCRIERPTPANEAALRRMLASHRCENPEPYMARTQMWRPAPSPSTGEEETHASA